MTVYRAYLSNHRGGIVSGSKVVTDDVDVALEGFRSLVCRTDLDGQSQLAMLSRNRVRIATHRFDRPPGDPDYWRDRLDDLPPMLVVAPASRPQVLVGGRRVNVYLDAEAISTAEAIGDSVSDGIRKALKQANPGRT